MSLSLSLTPFLSLMHTHARTHTQSHTLARTHSQIWRIISSSFWHPVFRQWQIMLQQTSCLSICEKNVTDRRPNSFSKMISAREKKGRKGKKDDFSPTNNFRLLSLMLQVWATGDCQASGHKVGMPDLNELEVVIQHKGFFVVPACHWLVLDGFEWHHQASVHCF